MSSLRVILAACFSASAASFSATARVSEFALSGSDLMPSIFSLAFLLFLSGHNGWDYEPPVFAVQIKITVQSKYAAVWMQFAHSD